jgi:hypothetical protein
VYSHSNGCLLDIELLISIGLEENLMTIDLYVVLSCISLLTKV